MPVPFPEVFAAGGNSVIDAPWKRLVSLQVVVLDWLTLNQPISAPPILGLGTRLNSRQWSAVRMLMYLARDSNTPEFVKAVDMGRSAAKVEALQQQVEVLGRAAAFLHEGDYSYFGSSLSHGFEPLDDHQLCGALVGEADVRSSMSAKPLKADRIQFGTEPSFDPTPFFDAPTLHRYEHPLSDGLSPDEVDRPPHVKVLASKSEKLLLFRNMARAKMLEPLVPGSFHDKFRSGLFGVHKDEHRDRMVLDGRPANLVDKSQSRWCASMASAASLAQIVLQDNQVLVCSGEDLKDFFYQFSVPQERTCRNVLVGSLTVDDMDFIFDGALPDHVTATGNAVGLSSLAMGDKNAVEFAQCSHAGVCLAFGVASSAEMLGLHTSIPRSLLRVGIIVDDLVILEVMLRQTMDDPDWFASTESSKRILSAREAYAAVGLKNNPKKGFAGETSSHFWGVEIDGDKGLLRCSSSRLWPTSVITMRVISLGLATVGLLEALAGSWVSLLGVRRRLYCVMNLIFQPLGWHDRPKSVVRLSPELKSELACLVCLGSLAVVNLRAQHSDFVSATDASTTTMAGVRASLPSPVVAELSRHALRKGNWSHLLPPGRARLRERGELDPCEELPEGEIATHPFWSVLANCLDYKEAWVRRVRRACHINVLELRAHLHEERRLATSCSPFRIPFGLDSQVALGCLVKGRAASLALNRELQLTLGYPLGSDLYGLYMYYMSEENPADDPTRQREVRSASQPVPAFFDDLCAGTFATFDRWLGEQGVDREGLAPPWGDLEAAVGFAHDEGVAGVQTVHDFEDSLETADVKDFSETVGSGGDRDKVQRETKLSEAALSALNSFDRGQFMLPDDFDGFFEAGALDLFSGTMGVAKQMILLGAPWVLCFEWERSRDEDLLLPSVREKIILLMREGAVRTYGAAPICASFSVAVTPPVRTAKRPRGIAGLSMAMRKKVSDGNSHNDFMADLVKVAIEMDIYFFVENPDTSWWWRQRRWKTCRASDSSRIFRCCFCAFGKPWKKATRIATNTALAGYRKMCRGGDAHVRLRGQHPTRKIPWTLVAQPYPAGLNRMLAAALCSAVKWCSPRRLSLQGCAKVGNARIGEASNPGPRSRRWTPRSGSLFELNLQSDRTLALESRVLREFLNWCNRELRDVSAEDWFRTVPIALPAALRCYGEHLYKSGGALSNFRHLILAAQRWIPLAKPYMTEAWEMVERWEAITPVKHRAPIPEVLVRAMCVVGWHWGWRVWVAATLIAFYGAGRLGEVLRCNREDLLLPEDVLQPADAAIFLRLRSFKSRLRQPAKVQHMKIANPEACFVISRVFRKLRPDSPLFDASPYQYRKRWNLILSAFGLDGVATLTPGGLRAGSAVFHYRNGKSIQDLMWLLRLRSQTTLESYLQEVAALNTLVCMSAKCRSCILSFAATFCHLAAAL
eukprot:Skav218189  [mRNA]  locus=scaffold5213:273982:278268:- [translate_table: standard]